MASAQDKDRERFPFSHYDPIRKCRIKARWKATRTEMAHYTDAKIEGPGEVARDMGQFVPPTGSNTG